MEKYVYIINYNSRSSVMTGELCRSMSIHKDKASSLNFQHVLWIFQTFIQLPNIFTQVSQCMNNLILDISKL